MADPTCDLPLVAVNNEYCATTDKPLGKQVVGIVYQDMAGTAPDLLTVPATGADPRLGTLQDGLTATGVNKLFILKNIAGATVPAAADTTLSGNDVPYGGTRITDRVRTMTGRVDYLTPSNSAALNSLTARQKPLRHWEFDEEGGLQGPFENSTFVASNILKAGIGGAPTHRLVTVTTRGLDERPFQPAPLVGIQGLINA
jgi:hypothetical protein